MMTSLRPEPRGFSGRPLIALVFAVGAGILGSYAGSWLHVNDVAASALVMIAVGAVAYLWYRAEKPK